MIKFQQIELKAKRDLLKISKNIIALVNNKHIGKTVILFKTDRNEVSISSELLKILSKLKGSNTEYLILTNSLTLEGITILHEKKIEYITRSDFGWTDESYISIKE